MKTKKLILIALGVLVVGTGVVLFATDDLVDSDQSRTPASIPQQFESLAACEKQQVIWKNVEQTKRETLPPFRSFGPYALYSMSKQAVVTKHNHVSDFSPEGWVKYIHARSSLAKVRIVPRGGPYTGLFQGADCALLRLSLTFKPAIGRGVAPGLALKILRDHTPSANVSALVSLAGQGNEYNFFANPMSNIVPIGEGLGAKLVRNIFLTASRYPEELQVEDIAHINARGEKSAQTIAPRQIFFVPGPDLVFSSDEHDVRHDFSKIASGTVIYKIYAASEQRRKFDYNAYTNADAVKFLADAQHIADIVTTSEFVASAFGDDRLFFRHQMRR